MNNKISVILPAYNERENIIPLIERTLKAIPQEKEIIVIDDNSPDGTFEVVADFCKINPIVRLINRKNERGLCSAVQRGINEATGDIIVWMDCDLSMPPEKIPDLIDKIINDGLRCRRRLKIRPRRQGQESRFRQIYLILSHDIKQNNHDVYFVAALENRFGTGQADLSRLKATL